MLAYIDESGLPNPNDSCTRPVLAALCVKEDVDRQLRESLDRYKQDLIGRDVELKGTGLLTRRIFGGRYSAKWVSKRELVERVFHLVATSELCVFAVIMERPEKEPLLEPETLPWQHRALLQRINVYLEQYGRHDTATLIYDGEGVGGFPGGLASRMTRYLYRHAKGRTFTRIVTTPMFVDSRTTPGVQLIDMIASCIRQYEERELYWRPFGSDPFLSALDRYYAVIRNKTVDLRISNPDLTLYGLYRMPESYFYLSEEKSMKGIAENALAEEKRRRRIRRKRFREEEEMRIGFDLLEIDRIDSEDTDCETKNRAV